MPFEEATGFPHRIRVPVVLTPPYHIPQVRPAASAVPDKITVLSPQRAAPRVEVVRNSNGSHQRYVRRQVKIRGYRQAAGVPFPAHAERHYLSDSVHSAVGAPGAYYSYRLVREVSQRFFQHLLNAHSFGLALPSRVFRPYVRHLRRVFGGGDFRGLSGFIEFYYILYPVSLRRGKSSPKT